MLRPDGSPSTSAMMGILERKDGETGNGGRKKGVERFWEIVGQSLDQSSRRDIGESFTL